MAEQDRGASGIVPGPVAFLGLGLIGGSIARALRRASPAPAIVGWTPSGAGPRAALDAGVIDRGAGSVAAAVDGAALVVLAAPPLAVVELLADQAETLRAAAAAGATITDVASTKAQIVATAERAGLPFVGGHPMAGRESSGFEAAEAGLFDGRPWVVVPAATARTTDIERVDALAGAVGARPVHLAADAHDAAVAAISHLPLVAAAALVESVSGSADWPTARDLAAGGWVGMTRLARGDIEMGVGTLATNRAATVERLVAFREAIDAWIVALSRDAADPRGEVEELRARLVAARATLERAADA